MHTAYSSYYSGVARNCTGGGGGGGGFPTGWVRVCNLLICLLVTKENVTLSWKDEPTT